VLVFAAGFEPLVLGDGDDAISISATRNAITIYAPDFPLADGFDLYQRPEGQ
jgi:hypothetical protein